MQLSLLWRQFARFWHAALPLAIVLFSAQFALAESLEQGLLADARDGQLDDHDFLAAALIASGVAQPCDLAGWLERYDGCRAQILTDDLSTLPPNRRLAIIHAALHERILKGRYQSTATDLRVAFARGDYNCLSALALYLDLCDAADLNVEIWLLPGHVCLRTAQPGGGTIEPGTAGWQLAFSQPLAEKTARRITRVELLGKFYYNRGNQLLEQHRFAAGLALLKTSVALDAADQDARENLAAGLNNWAVEHCRSSQYDRAAELIGQGLSLAPAFAPLIANERLVRAKLQH